jgi:iron-sulfur cluster assembly protein
MWDSVCLSCRCRDRILTFKHDFHNFAEYIAIVRIKGEKMITLTPVAIDKVKSILAGQEENNGLRIKVASAGCSGFQYRMTLENESEENDEIFDMSGLKLFIDKQSLFYLNGTVIDYIESDNGSGFKFENPNRQSSCGCGETFEA